MRSRKENKEKNTQTIKIPKERRKGPKGREKMQGGKKERERPGFKK